MTRTPGLHDPNVSTDEWAERVDIDYDHYPTRAELADDPTWPALKRPIQACEDCDHTLCLVQRTVERWVE